MTSLNNIKTYLFKITHWLKNGGSATLDARIDKVIKENFTAIHPVVEWKFTEAALNYLLKSETDEDAKIEEIIFDNVFPLYGAIDIKNSSEERNKALELNQFKEFDESITRLNKLLAKFLDKEQRTAQKIYPHYFERFVTDGVDFNLYAGQSIVPRINFRRKHLEDLRLWQLVMMVKAARLTAGIVNELPIPLETTQLVLVHSRPLRICFRLDERRFDVKGSYDVLYEIMKKRIDKVHIKTSGERLTKPHTIAIVYADDREGDEYRNYLQILTEQGLLKGEPESLDLEELQGVKGLKALRQEINYNMEYTGSFTVGSITSKGLIKPSLSP